jgi:hypothetical protein
VPVQLWTLRRIGVTAMLVASLAAGIAVFAGYMKVAGLL